MTPIHCSVITDAYGGAAARATCIHHGGLPFTGVNLVLFLIIAISLIAGGVALRRLSREEK